MIDFKRYQFTELSADLLYAILVLREAVFILEQQCRYQDLDGKDTDALHLVARESGQVVAYLRVFSPTEQKPQVTFGRVVTAKTVRRKGIGTLLMRELLAYCAATYPGLPIACSAQCYLQAFYERFGFVVVSKNYMLDDIPHVDMCKV